MIVYVAFSNLSTLECVLKFMRLRECFHRLRVDGRPKRIQKFAFTIVFVWTGTKVHTNWMKKWKLTITSNGLNCSTRSNFAYMFA